MATKPKAPDPVAWAKATPRAHGGIRCSTCASPTVMAVLRKWIPLWRSGAINISGAQAVAHLREHYGYRLTPGTLRKCLASHHGTSLRG